MSLDTWNWGEAPQKLFEKGTRVRFIKEIRVGDSQFGDLISLKVLAGATGVVLAVVPRVRLAIDAGDMNPYDIENIEVHKSILCGGMIPLREDGRANLRLVVCHDY